MSDTAPSPWAAGYATFAAIMLIVIGVFQAMAGIAAIVNDDIVFWTNVDESSYVFSLDTAPWGWTHLIIGIVVFLAGLGVMSGQVWARTIGVIVAGISAIVNFAFIPVYPVWAIVIIAIDVTIIWALTVHGRDITKA